MKYKIELYSEWHCSSGLDAGTDTNLLPITNKNGLPFIPGRTIKGLLSEAARELTRLNYWSGTDNDFIKICFGTGDNGKQQAKASQSICFYSNAELSPSLAAYFLSAPEPDSLKRKQILFINRTSTAIGESGTAEKKTLRTIQMTVPLPLYGEIDRLPEEYKVQMGDCLKWIKNIGLGRTRRAGRCDLTVLEEVKE